MDDRQFHQLLRHFGFSRTGYQRVRKGVKKRLRRHMQDLHCRHVSDYLNLLAGAPAERSECLRRLAVPISRFMRDRIVWEVLAARVLPDLARRFGFPLKVWSAGCACGEEVYSLTISARSGGGAGVGEPAKLDILATDRNPAGLIRAREGIYPRSSFRELDPGGLDRCFTPLRGGRRYRIRPEYQTGICWLCSDIACLPVRGRFHLILLRNNLLTYLDQPSRQTVLPQVLERIQPGGVLVVGRRERLPAGIGGMVVPHELPCIYERPSGV